VGGAAAGLRRVAPWRRGDQEDILEFLDGRVAKWWIPDDVVFIDEVPKTSVGKFSKKTLRDQFADYQLPGVEDA
jgi:fatty-acyl-CoA synthase